MQSSGVKPGCKLASLQALKLRAYKLPAASQGLKPQARINKLQDLRTRVQAHKPTSGGASNKDKGILGMFHVKRYLVRGEGYFVPQCHLQFDCNKGARSSIGQYIRSAK